MLYILVFICSLLWTTDAEYPSKEEIIQNHKSLQMKLGITPPSLQTLIGQQLKQVLNSPQNLKSLIGFYNHLRLGTFDKEFDKRKVEFSPAFEKSLKYFTFNTNELKEMVKKKNIAFVKDGFFYIKRFDGIYFINCEHNTNTHISNINNEKTKLTNTANLVVAYPRYLPSADDSIIAVLDPVQKKIISKITLPSKNSQSRVVPHHEIPMICYMYIDKTIWHVEFYDLLTKEKINSYVLPSDITSNLDSFCHWQRFISIKGGSWVAEFPSRTYLNLSPSRYSLIKLTAPRQIRDDNIWYNKFVDYISHEGLLVKKVNWDDKDQLVIHHAHDWSSNYISYDISHPQSLKFKKFFFVDQDNILLIYKNKNIKDLADKSMKYLDKLSKKDANYINKENVEKKFLNMFAQLRQLQAPLSYCINIKNGIFTPIHSDLSFLEDNPEKELHLLSVLQMYRNQYFIPEKTFENSGMLTIKNEKDDISKIIKDNIKSHSIYSLEIFIPSLLQDQLNKTKNLSIWQKSVGLVQFKKAFKPNVHLDPMDIDELDSCTFDLSKYTPHS